MQESAPHPAPYGTVGYSWSLLVTQRTQDPQKQVDNNLISAPSCTPFYLISCTLRGRRLVPSAPSLHPFLCPLIPPHSKIVVRPAHVLTPSCTLPSGNLRANVLPDVYDAVMAEYDWTKAAAARDEALQRVDEHADQDWKREARDAVLHAAAHRAEFTSDYIWWLLQQRGVMPPHEPRALGAIMRAAAREGLIQRSDRVVESVRVANHRRPVAVWRSLVYGQQSS